MNFGDLVFRARVLAGRPFRQVREKDLNKFSYYLESAVATSVDFKAIPYLPPDLKDDVIKHLARYLQVTGPDSNFAHGKLLSSLSNEVVRLSPDLPVKMLDIGTARGFSAICMSLGLRENDSIVSLDHLPHHRPFFWGTVSDVDFGKVTRADLISHVWGEIANIEFRTESSQEYIRDRNERHNLIFLDGQHDFEAVSKELSWSVSNQGVGDFILVDDYDTKYPGVTEAANEILLGSKKYDCSKLDSSDYRSYLLAKRVAGN